MNKIQEEAIFDLLFYIYIEKTYLKIIQRKKCFNYINRNNYKEKANEIQIKLNKIEDKTEVDPINSISNNNYLSNLLYKDENSINMNIEIGKIQKKNILLIRSLLISIYIYYQNKNSILIKYREQSYDVKKMQIIPFEYDISEAAIEKKFSGIVLSPLRIEPRIDGINVSRNILKENGFIELGKVLLFNKNIKKIDFHTCLLKSSYINYLNNILGIFDNHYVKVLNLSYNYLKEDCSEYLANILTHFKKLKSINLSCNDFKRGISSFIIALKTLYRQGKSDLESLNLNKCILDDISYFELGELLKSKYCKLKKLYLNDNDIPSNTNFLKKLKNNKCLTQIYFNKSNIGNNDTYDIMKIISNSNIEYLYLNKNRINDFSQCLRIIYRTKLIKREETKIKGETNLYNLDLSNKFCFNKNKDKIELLLTSIEDTTLYCLDASKILYDDYTDKFNKMKLNKEYITSIDALVGKLDKEQKKYNKTIGEIIFNKIDQQKLLKINYNEYFKNIVDQILIIVKDKKAKYNIFLRKSAEGLISNNNEIRKQTINNGKEDKEKYKQILDNLIKYMNLKRVDIKIEELYKIKNSKKMIII